MAQVLLAPRELLFIAALSGSTEFMGIPDAFFGIDDSEFEDAISAIQAGLNDKGYAEQDFDGGFSLSENVLNIVDTCANCDAFIVLDKNKPTGERHRDRCYIKDGQTVRITEDDGSYSLTEMTDTDMLLTDFLQDIDWLAPESSLLGNLKVPSDVLTQVRSKQKGFDSTDSIHILTQAGCDELSAGIVIEGLAEKLNYYSIIGTVLDGEKEGVYSCMLIDSQKGIYRIQPVMEDEDEFVLFTSMTSMQARTALEETLGSVF